VIMLVQTEKGMAFCPGTNQLGATFTEEFRRVWGTYFPWIVLGTVSVMVFALLRKLIK